MSGGSAEIPPLSRPDAPFEVVLSLTEEDCNALRFLVDEGEADTAEGSNENVVACYVRYQIAQALRRRSV